MQCAHLRGPESDQRWHPRGGKGASKDKRCLGARQARPAIGAPQGLPNSRGRAESTSLPPRCGQSARRIAGGVPAEPCHCAQDGPPNWSRRKGSAHRALNTVGAARGARPQPPPRARELAGPTPPTLFCVRGPRDLPSRARRRIPPFRRIIRTFSPSSGSRSLPGSEPHLLNDSRAS